MIIKKIYILLVNIICFSLKSANSLSVNNQIKKKVLLRP